MWNKSIKNHIDKHLKSVGVNITTQLDFDLKHTMLYNKEFNKIKICGNAGSIHRKAEIANMDIEDYLTICAAYEIGRSLNNKDAYISGKTFVPKELMKNYIKLNRLK